MVALNAAMAPYFCFYRFAGALHLVILSLTLLVIPLGLAVGPPDRIHNCTIQNETEDALHVECIEGFDGGLPQYFIMEVYSNHELKSNVSSLSPVFHVNGLESGTGFTISIYAANPKGRGETLALQASTQRIPEKRIGAPALFTITPILGVLIGVVVALVLVAIIIVIVMRLRAPDEKKTDSEDNDSVQKGHVYLKKELEDFDNLDEKNPDVVPSEDDAVYADVDEKVDQKLNNINNRIYENLNQTIGPNLNECTQYENVNNLRNQQQQRRPPNGHEDVTYAELQLPNNHRTSSVVHRGAEPTVYAQIDHTRKAPPGPDTEEEETAETPLMNTHRESTVQDYGSGRSLDEISPATVSSTQF